MDLAEIRKKARQQGAEAQKKELVKQTESSTPAGGAADEGDLSLRDAPPGSSVGLQQYFPDLQFASEEEYIQGLTDQHSSSEIEAERWLTFMLGEEEYALPLEVVHELIKPRNYTDLPKVPEYIRGILSLRGEIVPVIDLGKRLKLTRKAETGSQRIVVCDGKDQLTGLLVDRITQVVKMPKEAVEPTPLILNDVGKEFVSGVGRVQGRMLILLNPDEVLKI